MKNLLANIYICQDCYDNRCSDQSKFIAFAGQAECMISYPQNNGYFYRKCKNNASYCLKEKIDILPILQTGFD